MSKQDRQGVRTPANLEQKYNFGNVFSRLNAENQSQNLTMRQFAELVTETIEVIQKDISGLNKSVESLNKKDKELEKKDTSLGDKISAYWKTIYPVGAIYVSVSATSPAKLFGGTWVQIKDRFLLASGSSYKAGSTGGEATHKLTVDEMPKHKHSIEFDMYTEEGTETGWSHDNVNQTYTTRTVVSSEAGGGLGHNNMPPYLAVYVWKRTE